MLGSETQWTLPTLIGLPIIGIILLGGVLIILGATFYGESGDRAWIIVPTTIVLLVVAGLGGYGFWPWKAEYHQWREVSGTVQQLDKRLMTNADGNIQERYVVVFKETGEPFACDDTRCSLLKVGEPVTLACKKEWVYASTDGWGCRYRSNELEK